MFFPWVLYTIIYTFTNTFTSLLKHLILGYKALSSQLLWWLHSLSTSRRIQRSKERLRLKKWVNFPYISRVFENFNLTHLWVLLQCLTEVDMYHMAAVCAWGLLLLLCPREGHKVPNCQHNPLHLSSYLGKRVTKSAEKVFFTLLRHCLACVIQNKQTNRCHILLSESHKSYRWLH